MQELQQRAIELRASGVPEARVMEILQEELSSLQQETPASEGSQPSRPEASPAPPIAGSEPTSPSAAAQESSPPPAVNTPTSVPPQQPTATQPEDLEKDAPFGIFGHGVFSRETPSDTVLRLIPPPGYVIGPGDVFTVTIYGASELTESLLVTEDGAILRRLFGKFYVSGMTFEEARKALEQKYRRLVDARSVIEINLTPNQRTTGVNIVGEVSRPGFYQVPASIPAFRAILQAGGITEIGSVRNIQVKRNGRTVHTIDIYDYLLKGDYQPFFLQEGDFVFVPVQGKIVSIGGAVNRPMKYELKEDENLALLLDFAGGLTYNAMTENIELRRLEIVPGLSSSGPKNEKQELIINLNLEEVASSLGNDYQLFSGDKIRIQTLNTETYNQIEITGSVKYPGTYQLFQGELLSDVINRAGGLEETAFLGRAYILRRNLAERTTDYLPVDLTNIFPDSGGVNTSSPDNIRLEFQDKVQVFSQTIFLEERSLVASGQIRKPGTYKIYPSMNLKDLLYLMGGFEEDADLQSVELSLMTEAEDVDVNNLGDQASPADTGSASLIRRISIDRDWRNDPSLDTVKIFDFNRIKVYSRYDFIFSRDISINGAVQSPGKFPVKRGMSLTDLLYLAGGPSEPIDNHIVELYKIIELDEKGYFGTSGSTEEIIRISISGDWRNNETTDSLDITGFYKIVVRSEMDFVRTGEIKVKGLVQNPGTYDVLAGMTVMDLLYQVGGFEIEADLSHIELSRIIEVAGPNGEIVPVPTTTKLISTSQDWQNDSTLASIELLSFDQIFVRSSPDFNLQESVFLAGEVETPGEYVKAKKDERISSFVARANGITDVAHLEGAYLVRPNVGKISIRMEKALLRPESKYDLVLLEGDSLYIPTRTDAVTITGNVLVPGTIVMYDPGNKRFRYYLNLAGGFARKSRKKDCTITYVDGRTKRVKRFLFFKFYPKVEQGAVLNVPPREEPESKEKREWNLQPEQVLSSATAILTFILLLDRAVN